jgi:hypothetical protein
LMASRVFMTFRLLWGRIVAKRWRAGDELKSQI